MRQTTIKKAIDCSGIGLHGGKMVRLSLLPAPEDTGILFCLKGETGTRFISPSPESVVATGLATTLGFGEQSIATVEHLLAAIRGLEIDNITIEVEGGEVPIMDGSAASFVFLLRAAGIRRQARARKVYRLTRAFNFEHEGKWIKAEPYDGLCVDYTIDFPHPLIQQQSLRVEMTPEAFASKVAKARTFGFLRDVEMLQKNGMALGGSLDNAVVLDEYSVVNKEGLRFKDEFVRHKILDFLGDMAVLGLPLQGRFTVHCAGHALHNAFLRAVYENRDLYLERCELCEPEAVEQPAASPVGVAAAAAV
ncbi:MAG: UDP-3-O-acyl-N-acetylglucosamine deacetylase [Desulfovibrionaceae bacterium]|jgi:UDP-3-O-[3-hydroxymyristoyl] N-acetylglucosamine deacetylase|nr:UDP-3-O-acyl-N-acetylglucosamine deacetylase [Desulfovibrionaceae bacterium]